MCLYSKIMDLGCIFFLILPSYTVFVIICSGYVSQLYKKLQLAFIMCTKYHTPFLPTKTEVTSSYFGIIRPFIIR